MAGAGQTPEVGKLARLPPLTAETVERARAFAGGDPGGATCAPEVRKLGVGAGPRCCRRTRPRTEVAGKAQPCLTVTNRHGTGCQRGHAPDLARSHERRYGSAFGSAKGVREIRNGL